MLIPPLLLLSDVDSLRRKVENPPAGLDAVVAEYYKHLADPQYRKENIFLPALLGDKQALQEVKESLLESAQRYADEQNDTVKNDSFGYGTGAMRDAVYATWLEYHGCWTPAEWQLLAHTLRFGYDDCVNVLRGRVPTSDNQSTGIGFSCAIMGYVYKHVPGFEEKGQALFDFGLRRVKQVMSLSPRDGYLYEGATYQSYVVTPYAMWVSAFLTQIEGPGAERKVYHPNGATLLDILRTEIDMPSPSGMLPGWDHYGWRKKSNLAATAIYANLTGDLSALENAADVIPQNEGIAWRFDDRMWAIVYWPDAPIPAPKPKPILTGWTLPQTAAVIDDHQRNARLLLAWDRCGDTRQAHNRNQINPNHLLYELDGQTIFADGVTGSGDLFIDVDIDQVSAEMPDNARELLSNQYGSVEGWVKSIQHGFPGAANVVLIDHQGAYYPDDVRRGQVCFEQRTSERHIVTGDSIEYYLPYYDLTRARRTISTNADNGVSWIVDDYRAASEHDFTWQLYLRQGGKLEGNTYPLITREGVKLTLAWLPVEDVKTKNIPNFPHLWYRAVTWPEEGSDRLQLTRHGKEAHFVTVIVPHVTEDVTVRQAGDRTWTVEWPGGSDTFTLPLGADGPLPPMPEVESTFDDIDATPFALSNAPTEELLATLQAADPANWRGLSIAAQTLVERKVEQAYPLIQRLLRDRRQFYVTTAVATGALGKALYAPALADLQYLTETPEPNTAFRARWAVARIEKSLAK